MNLIATKTDWKNQPLPLNTKELSYSREFTNEEMELIKRGLIPKQMEDKWFIYFENNILNFYRSWTGHQIFQITFSKTQEEKWIAIKTLVNRDSSQYNQPDDAYEIVFLNFLIDRLLLNKQIPFPLPPDIEKEKHSILKHSMIGYGRSNNEE